MLVYPHEPSVKEAFFSFWTQLCACVLIYKLLSEAFKELNLILSKQSEFVD